MKYTVLTFGCRANQADACDLERQLRSSGGLAADSTEADLVVVNTCTVTAAADQAARTAIRRIARTNPSARIIATGCYATSRPDELRQLPGVVSVVPNRDKPAVGSFAGTFSLAPGTRGRTAYPIKVQTGCDEQCAYCVVPRTRGAGLSRAPEAVRDEVLAAGAAGYREVWISGVHLGSYGRDSTPRGSLLALLRSIESAASGTDLSFRLCSLEPMDCSDQLVAFLAESRRFVPHVHLPMQHASDRVLEAMRRPYTLAQFDAVVGALRRRLPDAAIGTDLIAGFPGETERDFVEQVEYLRRSPLTHVHVFPYSDRPGTEASAMPRKLPGATIRQRATTLREVAAGLHETFVRTQAGRERDALTLADGTVALTDNYLKVRIAPGRPRNERVRVRITSAQPLAGEVVGRD